MIEFYGELVQNLKRWQAPPPKLPETQAVEVPETPQSDAPPFASDGRDLGEATSVAEPSLATTPDQPDYDT